LLNNTDTAMSSSLLTDGSTLLKNTRYSGVNTSLRKSGESAPLPNRLSKGDRRSMPISYEKKEAARQSILPVDSDQLLYFGRVPINSTQIYEIRICNPSDVVMKLEGWTCSSPFSAPRKREGVRVEPRSFILLPVAFVPKRVDVFYGSLEVRWRGERVLLRLVGESFDLTTTF
jgi:hypothetical protein